MKSLIKRLEKSYEFWALLCISVFFFLLRLPSLFEPYWYGDEAIYETIGRALRSGRILYTQIWDNKPPLLYYTYAIVDSNQFWIRFLSLAVGICTVIIFFLLAKKVLQNTKATSIATFLFALSFGLPLFEGNIANAENFMLLPIVVAAFMIYRQQKTEIHLRTIFYAGILIGIAFLYKIVAVFDFAALGLFLVITLLPNQLSIRSIGTFIQKNFRLYSAYLLGFILPFLLSLLYFTLQGGLVEYIGAIFLSTFGYVGYNNVFIIPQGLLITKLIILTVVSLFLLLKRKSIPRPILFILLWLSFALFSSYFSQRPYTHYMIVLLLPFALLVGSVLRSKNMYRVILGAIMVVILLMTLSFFDHWNGKKTISYYTNFLAFVTNRKSVTEYNAFFDGKTNRDNKIATYITMHANHPTSLFMWGNSPQLYVLTNTLPPGRFTVAYHIAGNQKYQEETALALKKAPDFLVILLDSPHYPFDMYNYRQVFQVENAVVYERIY